MILKGGLNALTHTLSSHRFVQGAALHPINTRLAPAQINYIVDHAEDDVTLVDTDFLPPLEEIMPQVKCDTRLILLPDEL